MSQLHSRADDLYGSHITHKDPHYLTAYNEIFDPIRNNSISLLELGVSTGASLALWAEYFSLARIAGVDILPRPSLVPNLERVAFFQGSQDDPLVLDRARRFVGGQFDIVIDDASHFGAETRRSFDWLFPHVKPGGYYIIEDCGSSFMRSFPDFGEYPPEPIDNTKRFPSHDYGIMGVTKQIMDEMFLTFSHSGCGKGHIESMLMLPHIAFIKKSS